MGVVVCIWEGILCQHQKPRPTAQSTSHCPLPPAFPPVTQTIKRPCPRPRRMAVGPPVPLQPPSKLPRLSLWSKSRAFLQYKLVSTATVQPSAFLTLRMCLSYNSRRKPILPEVISLDHRERTAGSGRRTLAADGRGYSENHRNHRY